MSVRVSDRPNPEDKPALPVWMVNENKDFEEYSNGLRIEKSYATANRPRESFAVFGPGGEPTGRRGREPVGIVFHSSESHQAPFEPSETRTLTRLGRGLLDFVRQQRAYHYVIDRFGRVYRVVREQDAANHAGRSVWGTDRETYVYLNDSFLGVALEAESAKTISGDTGGEAVSPNDPAPGINTAQIHGLRILTEMLRAKYGIPKSNCVTHAQVSVNPLNHRIGYHTDWAMGFPFAAIGLPDNYRLSLTSVTAFGFEDDDSLLAAAGDVRWPGLRASLEEVRERAAAAKLPEDAYRRQLQQRFQQVLSSARMREQGEDQ